MNKPSLLFLAHRIPFPPNKGDKIRSFNLLKVLAKDYSIYLGAFVDDANDWQYEQELKAYCKEVYLRRLGPGSKYKALTGLLTGEALTLPHYRNKSMNNWVEKVMAEASIERVFIYSSAMAQYAMSPSFENTHRVIDFVDVDSEKWRDYSVRRRWPASWIYGREAKQLLAFDTRVATQFDISLFVSQPEADLFKTLAPEASTRVHALSNGVDIDYFSPTTELECPYEHPDKTIVFTGAMDYWANVDAMCWFAKNCWPAIRQRCPEAQLYIVGARPSEAITQLANQTGITVTGAVRDIRPYIAHAKGSVAPMQIARGIQNKVLEAMALAKPVIATRAAWEGIDLKYAFQSYDDSESTINACVELLSMSTDSKPYQALGAKGHALIHEAFNWDQHLVRLEDYLGDNSRMGHESQTAINELAAAYE